MKPTKEQLADPKWWQNNSNGCDYAYYNKSTLQCVFVLHAVSLKGDLWELLAKRPKPEWVPAVGEWFTASGGAQMAFIGIDSGNAYVCEIKGGGLTRLYDFDGCKPVKTQREELIDIVNQRELAKNKAEAIADAILARFDLTEKDGN